MSTDTPPNGGQTIEDLLGYSLADLRAMSAQQIADYIRPALMEQEAILGSLPHAKKSTGVNLNQRGSRSSTPHISPDAAALVKSGLAEAGVDLDMLKRLGIKL